VAALALSDGIAFAVVRGGSAARPNYTLPALRRKCSTRSYVPNRSCCLEAAEALSCSASTASDIRSGPEAGTQQRSNNNEPNVMRMPCIRHEWLDWRREGRRRLASY
jgi:hypothetical protein